jgi:hypothetical protein
VGAQIKAAAPGDRVHAEPLRDGGMQVIDVGIERLAADRVEGVARGEEGLVGSRE